MKALILASLLVLMAATFIGCASGGSSSSAATAPKISGYIDTSIEHRSK